MTAGMTGVFWLPRLAEANSIMLNAGAHGIPISAAATAWGAMTGAWIDATTTAVRVMAELGIGMQGVNGIAALSRLGGFTGWAEQQGVMAATLGAKAIANATAYTVASIAMPSIPEIAAVNTARVAAASTGGVLNGSSEIAEAAKVALDVRAALTMETYEAATTATVATPGEFVPPPAIASGAGTADPSSAEAAFQGDPVASAIAAAAGFLNNPAVASAATQAANVLGSVGASGVSTVGSLGANAISAVTSAATPSMGGMAAAPMSMMGAGAAVSAAASATRSAASTPNANPNGSFKLPEGWGAGAAVGGLPATLAAAEPVNVARLDAAPVRPAAASGSPLLGTRAQNSEDDESEHTSADYLRADHFNDGRYTADGVIGADAAGTAK
ncbi:PPE domain-containing protein [Nocardia sp. GCM10030253]|uniref:PPE domain-containing protein n=1 Tax=Nocardia sp. GCM10030253 TaxID=3273404 RepID=UPI00363A7E5A